MLLEQDSSKQRINNIVIKPLTPMNSQGSVQETVDNQMVKSCSSDRKESKWKIVKHSNRRMLPRHSQGEIKLNNLIQELQKFSSEEKHHKTEHFSMPNSFNWVKISRQRLAYYLSLPTFHYSIIVLVILDLIVVLVDLVLGMYNNSTFCHRNKYFSYMKKCFENQILTRLFCELILTRSLFRILLDICKCLHPKIETIL
jgi:hypothetical protein